VSGPWSALIRSVDPASTFGAPVDEAALRACEAALGHPLSADVVALLRETDGVRTAYDDSSLWTLARIHEENVWIRTDEQYAELYQPFDDLCFFDDAGNGDMYGFVPRREAHGLHDIYRWDHEDDSRTWVAPDLASYIRSCRQV
jgi:hypothetical protein